MYSQLRACQRIESAQERFDELATLATHILMTLCTRIDMKDIMAYPPTEHNPRLESITAAAFQLAASHVELLNVTHYACNKTVRVAEAPPPPSEQH